jgi:hypothetical protein
LFEIYPDNNVQESSRSINGGNFNGYMSAWNLKTGFVSAVKFVNNQVVENGILLANVKQEIKVKGNTNVVTTPPIDVEGSGGESSPGVPLRPVVIQNNYHNPVSYDTSGLAYYTTGGTTFNGYNPITYTGGYIGGDNGGELNLIMPPPPDIPIADIIKFLSCLNTSASANLSVFAERMNILDKNVGHAFISISQGNNTMVFGYYPQNGNLKSLTGPGIMGENGGHYYDVSATMGISGVQLQQIINLSQNYQNADYDLSFNNCSDFATQVLNITGVSTTGFLDTPNTVADILLKLPNHTSNANYAPKTKRTCP